MSAGPLDRYARALASGAGRTQQGPLERAALRLTRRQALGAAAAGSLLLAAGAPRGARAQVLPQCPPPGFPAETQVCPYTCGGLAPSWICCRQDQVCCTNQPQVGGAVNCAVGCCEPGQTCCYSPSLGGWGCCGCPRGLHACGTEPLGVQCCQRDEVCDTVNFVCRPGDECPNVLCDGACCEPGEVCAGGSCCQAAKGCGGECCGRGMICDQNRCKQLVEYKRPKRQRQRKNDTIDSPELKTFDADLAAELNYAASEAGGSDAGAAASGFLIGRARVRLRAHSKRRVAVKLTRRARRRLRRGRPLNARLTLTFRDPAGRRITETERVTILPRRRSL
jgi:hypothetical protein